MLKAIFAYAVRADALGRTPCRTINLPRIVDNPRHQVTADDIERLSSAITPEYELMIPLAAVLGLRWGEVAGLRVRSIDFAAKTLQVIEQVVLTPGGGSTLGPPKSHAG